MLTCYEARLLLHYNARPGTARSGLPELGFHLASCAACRAVYEQRLAPDQPISSSDAQLRDDAFVGEAMLPPPAYSQAPSVLEHPPSYSEGLPGESWLQAVQVVSEQQAAAPQDPEVSAPRTVTYAALLRNHNFFRLWLGQAISTFGSYFTRLAVPIYVFSVTNSYAQLGFAYFSSVAAPLLFGLLAGALADRWDRRRTLVWTSIANGLVLVGLLLCTALSLPLVVKLGAIYATNFVAAVLQEMFRAARVAIFVDVLAEDELLTANSLDGATTTLGEFLSYPIAAAALFYIGPAIAFGIDAVSFFVSALLIAGVVTYHAASGARPAKSVVAEIREGLSVTQALPLVRKVVILSLIVPLLISLLNTLQLPYTVDALHSSREVGFPALEAAMALGVMLGMLILGRRAQRVSREALLAYGIAGYGLAIVAQGLVPQLSALAGVAPPSAPGPWTVTLLFALPFALLTGAANSMINASIRTTIQEQTPRVMLGRVYSVMNVFAGVGFAAGALLTGMAQGRPAEALVAVGLLMALIGLVSRRWLPERQARQFVMTAEY